MVFFANMHKIAASAQGETTPGFEVLGGKRPKLSDPSEEAHKSPTVINVDSPDRAFDAQLALEGPPWDSFREACAPSEDGIPTGGSPGAEGVVAKASLEVVVAPLFSTRLASVGPCRSRMPDRLLLSSYVPP